MTEIYNIVPIEELPLENKQLEQMKELSDINSNTQLELLSNNEQYNETLEFINECGMSIFNFTKDNTNEVILTPKVKIIKKKYKLYQYNLNIEQFIHIDNFTTFSEITKYLETLNIKINLKTLLKNKLFKIELII